MLLSHDHRPISFSPDYFWDSAEHELLEEAFAGCADDRHVVGARCLDDNVGYVVALDELRFERHVSEYCSHLVQRYHGLLALPVGVSIDHSEDRDSRASRMCDGACHFGGISGVGPSGSRKQDRVDGAFSSNAFN